MKVPAIAEGERQFGKRKKLKNKYETDMILFSDGFSYEKEALEEWFERGKFTSPMTNLEISNEIIENVVLKERISSFLRDFDFDSFDFDANDE